MTVESKIVYRSDASEVKRDIGTLKAARAELEKMRAGTAAEVVSQGMTGYVPARGRRVKNYFRARYSRVRRQSRTFVRSIHASASARVAALRDSASGRNPS